MLTKGAIGNLVNRYKAVLAKCNLINTFGSLAVAAMLVMGGAVLGSIDSAYAVEPPAVNTNDYLTRLNPGGVNWNFNDDIENEGVSTENHYSFDSHIIVDMGGKNWVINSGSSIGIEAWAGGNHIHNGKILSITSNGNGGIFLRGGDTKIDVDTLELNVSGSGAFGTYGKTTILANTVRINTNNTTGNAIQAYEDISFGSEEKPLKSFSVNGENYGRAIRTASGANVNISTDEIIIAGAQEEIKVTGDSSLSVKANRGSIEDNIIVGEDGSNGRADFTFGEGITFSGNVKTDTQGSSSTKIALNGATWNATGDSNVTNLALDGGNVNIPAEVDIDADNVSGNGNINMEDAENLGSFTAENAAGAELNVQATDKDGNVKNADGVDAATLTKMRAQVQAEGAAVTASAAEGDVNGAISVDAKGNVSTAKNTLMDAALKQASITTVALDKILTNDVRKRLGDIRSDKNQTGVWMRWDGGKLKGDGLTNNFNTIQIGGDTKVGTNCRIGVAGSFTHGDTDFARGNGELEGFSFALYSTWMGENGMFADIVTRLGHFSNEMNVEGRKGDMDNRVFSLSGEYGWRFDLCKQFFLEPQVELAYTYVSSDDLQLGTAHYAFDNVNSLVGRAGLVAGWNLPDDMGNVYARASVLQQFMGDAKISGSNGNAFNVQEIDGNDTWMEYGIGANVKLTDKTYIWADVERTAGADVDEEWRGTVGIRYSF